MIEKEGDISTQDHCDFHTNCVDFTWESIEPRIHFA
jgi:hypothetical protein